MTNNPLNGYQPEYADAITDAQEHNIEHAQAMQGDGNADSPALPTCRLRSARYIRPRRNHACAAYIGAGSGGRRQCGQPRAVGGSGKETRTSPRKRLIQSYGRNTPRRCRARICVRSIAKTRLFKQKRLCAASGRRA